MGWDYYFADFKITPVVTALAYNNVDITGGFVQNVLYTNVPIGLSDEGKLQGQGIFALNVARSNGISGFVQASVYGGQSVAGAGGKAGVRWQW